MLGEVVGRQRLGLADRQRRVPEPIGLQVALDHLPRGQRAEVGARPEEFLREGLRIEPREGAECLDRGAVARRRRRRGQQQRVGDDRGQQQAGDRPRRGQAGGVVVLGDDRGGAADRLEDEEDRLDSAQVAEVVVVDHPQQFGLLQPGHRLAAVVVVDEDHALAAPAQQIRPREDAPDVAVLVGHRQRADAGAEQCAAHVGGQILGIDGSAGRAHDLRDRQAQPQQACGGVGVVRRADQEGAPLPRQGDDPVGDGPIAGDDQAGHARPKRRLLRLFAVPDDHQVAGLEPRHQGRHPHRTDPDPPGESARRLPRQQPAAEGAQIALERHRHALRRLQRHLLQVAPRQFVDRELAAEPPRAVDDREEPLAPLAHQPPGLVEGGVPLDRDDLGVHRVGHALPHVAEQDGRRHAAPLQRVGRLGVRRPEPRRRRARQIGRAPQLGVGDRRADAIGVRVLVPDDVDGVRAEC